MKNRQDNNVPRFILPYSLDIDGMKPHTTNIYIGVGLQGYIGITVPSAAPMTFGRPVFWAKSTFVTVSLRPVGKMELFKKYIKVIVN